MASVRRSFVAAPWPLCAVLLAGACDLAQPAPPGHKTVASLGGTPDGNFPAVCVMKVTLGPDDMGNPRDPFYCTCSLVEAQTVLTSARCVYDTVKKDVVAATDIDVRFGTDFGGGTQYAVDSIDLHRYFDPDVPNVDELALIRLATSPGLAPVALNDQPLGQDLVGQDLSLVGFGARMTTGGDVDVRNKLDTPITQIGPGFVLAGTADATTCAADSGGPGFLDLGDGPVQVTLNARQSSCSATAQRARIDNYTADFLFPFIDRYSGACPLDGTCTTTGCRTPDPDCDPCAWQGTGDPADCMEDCPSRDWDCPLGSFVGEACQKDGDCEQGGTCQPAVDDQSFTYCTRPCDPAQADSCPQGMECSQVDGSNQCTYLSPSPGSQGAACDLNSQCRSNICEDDICVYPCGPDKSCPDPFTCGPSKVSDGMEVCLGQSLSGGGGFCAVGGDAGATSLVGLLLGLVGLPFVLRRRRPRR